MLRTMALGLVATTTLLSGCVYRMNIQQGNYLEGRTVDQLTVGMIGGAPPQTHTYEHVDSLKVLAESFADAVDGRGPFLVSPDEMLALIGAFEAIITSLKIGGQVQVPA